MATTPSLTPEAESGLESARSILARALSGQPAARPGTPVAAAASAPAAAPAPATPAPPPETEPASIPSGVPSSFPAGLRPPSSPAPVAPSPSPVPPVSPSGAPAGSPEPPRFTDPAAQRYLDMHGGNLEAALAKALRDNNRLSALARTHPDDFRSGGTADPNAAPVAPEQSSLFQDPTYPQGTTGPEGVAEGAPSPEAPGAPPVVAPDVPLDWNEITRETDRIATTVDQTCMGLARQWLANDTSIKEAAKQISAKSQRLDYLTNLLSPESGIELPELKVEDLKDERRTLQTEIGSLKQDAMLRVLHNKELDRDFNERRQRIYDHLAGQKRAAVQEQAFNSELHEIENAEYQRLSVAWPGAVSRTVTALHVPDELAADFENYARQMANVALQSPDFELADVDAFMSEIGRGYMERLDRYHRAQAANYGHLAAARALSPSPPPPPGTPAPVAPVPSMMTPEQAMDEASRLLRQRIRGG